MMSKKFFYLVFVPMFVFLMLLSQSCRSVKNFFRDGDEIKNCGGVCSAVVLEEIPSPDGKMKAVIFKVECPGIDTGGAKCPSGDSVSLSIMSKNYNLMADEREGNAVDYSSNLEVKWIGDRELLVGGDYSLGKDRQSVSTVEGVTVRYGKFQTKIELISEVSSPDGKKRAFVYRRVCKHPDSNQLEINTIEVGRNSQGYTSEFPPNQPPPCEKGYFYGTSADAKISLKWNGNNELLIIGSQPDGEKGLRGNKFGELTVKYQKAE